jgi:hypothetical protein
MQRRRQGSMVHVNSRSRSAVREEEEGYILLPCAVLARAIMENGDLCLARRMTAADVCVF